MRTVADTAQALKVVLVICAALALTAYVFIDAYHCPGYCGAAQ